MDNETEIIKACVQNLSKGMRDYLIKDTWPQKLSLIEQTNKLTEEQASDLKAEIFLTLIGIENYSDLKTNIKNNVVGISSDVVDNIVNDIEKNIFSEIKPLLDEIEQANNEAEKEVEEIHPDKETIINDIENPAPTKPIVLNPAGSNPILDAQHNLPEQEKKILIPSSAVPSRGPMLGNFRIQPIAKPVTPQPTPAPQPIPQPSQPAPTPQPISQPTTPPQTSTPSAPKKYTVDPYREPIE